MNLITALKYVIAYKDSPLVSELREIDVLDDFIAAVDSWLEGDTYDLLSLYRNSKIPTVPRKSDTLYRSVMLGPEQYEKFMNGTILKYKDPLQSWSDSPTMGTPYINVNKPIYLHFKHKFNPDEIVVDLYNDLYDFKQTGEISFDKHDLIEQESEVICESINLSKQDMDWEPFIPERMEEELEEEDLESLMEEYNLKIGDPFSM